MKNLLAGIILTTSMSLTYGQVGIGTTSPQEQLHIANGDVRVDNLTPNATSGTNVSVDANGVLILSKNESVSVRGKVRANGNAIRINGATCFRIDNGDYQINFNNPMSNANYLILLSNRNPTNSDAPIMSYYNVTANGFRIKIKDAYLLYDISIEFMFKVEEI